MSGYYDRVTMDSSYELARDMIDNRQYDYTLYRGAVMRQNRTEAPFMTPAQNVDFYGPLTGSRVTQESFIMGRAATASRNPDSEVNYLPESLFPAHQVKSTCDRIDLQPMFTRLKPSCNGLRQTDSSAYAMFPGAWEKGYLGYNSVVYNNLQSRIPPAIEPNLLNPCAENYASYTAGRSFKPYAP